MTSTAIYAAAISVFASAAVLLGVLLLLAARDDRIRAEHTRIRQRR